MDEPDTHVLEKCYQTTVGDGGWWDYCFAEDGRITVLQGMVGLQ